MNFETVTVRAGALQLPEEMQRALGLDEGTQLKVSIQHGSILLSRSQAPAASVEVAEQALQRLRQGFAASPAGDDLLQHLRHEWEERLERFCA
jgi:antitoxin component of MazEF toxin-antitoxin module